jgi:di/tricarboxylate transporter
MECEPLLNGNPQFILLVGVLTAILTLVLLTNRLVDLYYQKLKDKPEAKENAKVHIGHLSRITVTQLGVAVLLVVRILLSGFHKQYFWFDVSIVALVVITLVYWTGLHILYFRMWYGYRKLYCPKKSKDNQ